MALIVLASAAGSPGVTTTAVGLALTSARPALLVEADPTGGSAVLAGFFRGTSEHTGGLLDLAWAHREGRLAEQLPASTMPFPDSTATLLPGVRSHAQARNAAAMWEPLAAALRGLRATGQDVIVDAGRLGLAGSPEPLMYAADLALLVVRSDLVAVSAARSWAERCGTGSTGSAPPTGWVCCWSARAARTRPGRWPRCSACRWWRRWPGRTRGRRCSAAAPGRRAGSTSSAYVQSLRTAWTAIDAAATAPDELLTAGSEARP